MERFLWYFQEGGILMYPLALLSIVALAVIVERAMRLRQNRLIDGALVEKVQEHIENNKLAEASVACKDNRTLLARVLDAAMKEFINTQTDMETSLKESAERELQVLWNNLGLLNTVARVAPLLGLLGTVFGMIGAFAVLSEAGVGKEEMAHQIRVALITTAAGLVIAIPVVLSEAYFRGRIRKIVAMYEAIFIDIVKSVKLALKARETQQ